MDIEQKDKSTPKDLIDKKAIGSKEVKKPARKRTPLPKIDLEKSGLKLVETKPSQSKESVKEKVAPKTTKKVAWQKKVAAKKLMHV